MTTTDTPWTGPQAVDIAAADRPADYLRILCVLPTLSPYGGVISVVNMAERWLGAGHHVEILGLSPRQPDVLHPRTEPFHIANRDQIAQTVVSQFDVLLATSWETVEPVVQLAKAQPWSVPVYFVQDIEWELVPAAEPERRERAKNTYEQIDLKVVKTTHLQRRLAADGFAAERIVPGMNLDVFYPRDVPRQRRLLAMARPNAPDDQRGFQVIASAFAALAHRHPDLDFALFGSDRLPSGLAFPLTNFGVVPPAKLPELYSSALVYLDASRHHGFGRTGAEAMACGTPCVLSASGGIDDYAEDGRNALLVPVGDPDATATAISRLLEDTALAQRLAAEGRNTVAGFRDSLAAEQMLDIVRERLSRRSDRPSSGSVRR